MSEALDNESRLARPTMREQLLILGHTLLVPAVSHNGLKGVGWSSTRAEFPDTPPIRLAGVVEHFEASRDPTHRFRLESTTFTYDPDGNESMGVGIATQNSDTLNGDPFAIDMHQRLTHILATSRHLGSYALLMRDPQIRDFYAAEPQPTSSALPTPDPEMEPAYTVRPRRVVLPDNLLTMSTGEPPIYL